MATVESVYIIPDRKPIGARYLVAKRSRKAARMRRRRDQGDDRHVAVDVTQIARIRRVLGVIAVTCLVLAFLIPSLQGALLMVALFSWLGIGWVE